MEIDKYKISKDASIRESLKIIDQGGLGIGVVVSNENKVVGVITDGDFRRAVLQGTNLSNCVDKIYNKNFISVEKHESEKVIVNSFLKNNIERLLVLNNGELDNILLREKYYLEGKFILPESSIDIPVVIMAGGKGTRMAPFTNVFPKPLIPIGNRTMLEVIMDEYIKFGFQQFFISVNYKAKLIKAYFESFENDYDISYIEEEKFLGTAGSLRLLKFKEKTTIFIANCDISINENYLNILEFHQKSDFDLTLVAAISHYKVPYGVCSIKNGGQLDVLSEKPEYDYLINTGMYLLNSDIIELIPENEFYHMTNLVDEIQKAGKKIGVYPISEKSWFDVGQWDEYTKLNIIKN